MAKRISLIVSYFLLVVMTLAACRQYDLQEVEEEISSLRNALSETTAEAPASSAESSEGKAVEDNKAVQTGYKGILSSEYQIIGNKFYFRTQTLKMIEEKNRAVNITSYYDLLTGRHDVICPDPLCGHNDPSVCKYIDVGGYTDFIFADENTYIRGYRPNVNQNDKIYKFDLRTGEAVKLFSPKQISSDLIKVENGVLYLVDQYSKVKNGTSSSKSTLYGIVIETGEIVLEQTLPQNYRVICYENGKLFMDNVRSIVYTDLYLSDETTILEYNSADDFGTWYYDTNNDEFWFSIINTEHHIGKVYVYQKGLCDQIDFPVDEIYYFQLTDSRIYYSPYEPVYLGENPTLPDGLWDYSGGKIYEVSRTDPGGDPKLVYDANGEFFISRLGVGNYVIFDDELFFDKRELVTREDGVYFYGAGELPKVHIDLTTGMREFIRFE